MTDEQSIRDELARTMCEAEDSGTYSEDEGTCTWHFELADRVLASPVIRRIQAEAIRRVALESRDAHLNTRRGTYAQGQNVIVRDMYAFLCNRADRIERGETA